jgi:hypothetical protein
MMTTMTRSLATLAAVVPLPLRHCRPQMLRASHRPWCLKRPLPDLIGWNQSLTIFKAPFLSDRQHLLPHQMCLLRLLQLTPYSRLPLPLMSLQQLSMTSSLLVCRLENPASLVRLSVQAQAQVRPKK